MVVICVSILKSRLLMMFTLSADKRKLCASCVMMHVSRTSHVCVCMTGCGEGRLIDFLVRNAAFTSIQSITGVDISADALNSAGRRLEKLLVDCPSIIEDKKAAAGTAGDKRIEREGSTEDTFQQDSSVWVSRRFSVAIVVYSLTWFCLQLYAGMVSLFTKVKCCK